MQHRIPIADLGPHGESMARAVTTCVHCGFCLAACPTYKVMGEEMDSPRGRIVLMKQALEGELSDSDARPYIDRCLGCLSCETACPSGVKYRELVVPFRARLEGDSPALGHTARKRSLAQRAYRQALLAVLESPSTFRVAHAIAGASRLMAGVVPHRVRGAMSLLPPHLPPRVILPVAAPAAGARRGRVALLAGCVQQALRPSINTATVRVLTANGVEVVIPPDQGCCGALAIHSGYESRGARLAEHNARVFPRDVDAVLTNAAGCGAAMKEYAFPIRVMDVAEFLDDFGLLTPLALETPLTVAYHDACHLSHGQGIRSAPRRLLRRVDHLTLAELGDGEMCCGSAGLYNLEQPDAAAELGRRKAAAIRATGAQLVAAGNIGCITQIETHLGMPVRHTVEILDSAI